MDLVPYSDDDIGLVEELECDPETMRELGGPVSSDDLSEIHARCHSPSDALCRKFGLRLIEETDFDYRGSRLRVNVWELPVAQ